MSRGGRDFPGMIYGETTLAEIRKRFGSNGMAFRDRAPVVPTDQGLALLNAYEVGPIVVTFVTMVPKKHIEAVKPGSPTEASH
jgi:hypothetical protein